MTAKVGKDLENSAYRKWHWNNMWGIYKEQIKLKLLIKTWNCKSVKDRKKLLYKIWWN